jgi:hypothetical protein
MMYRNRWRKANKNWLNLDDSEDDEDCGARTGLGLEKTKRMSHSEVFKALELYLLIIHFFQQLT